MKSCTAFRVGVLWSIAALLLDGSPARAHDHTLPAYLASLGEDGAGRTEGSQPTRLDATEAAAASDLRRVRLRLMDAHTGTNAPGLIRVLRQDGSSVRLRELFNRGTKLRAGHPASDWHALVRPMEVTLPKERLTLQAFAGLETELAEVALDLASGEAREVTLPMKRFNSPAQAGWRNGNTHLHLRGMTRGQADEYLSTVSMADGLELVFVSLLRRASEDHDYISNEYTRHELAELSRGGVLFGNGQEHRHNLGAYGEGYGHVMLLNLPNWIEPVSIGPSLMGSGVDYPPLRQGIRRARGDGATVVWCHNTFGFEDLPNWLAGDVHAHNIFDGGAHGSYEHTFYRFLNAGLRVPFSTGTDWFIYDFSRVYVHLDHPLSVESWLEGLRAGRTFISNGPLLELNAGTHRIGDTVQLARPGTLEVTGRAMGRSDFAGIELIYNGEVVKTAASKAVQRHYEAELRWPLQVTEPGWLALRVRGGSLDSTGALVVPPNTPIRGSAGRTNEMGEALFAHTSPIYLELGGRRIFKPASAKGLIDDLAAAINSIRQMAQFDTTAQREEVLRIYQEAIEKLELQVKRAEPQEN